MLDIFRRSRRVGIVTTTYPDRPGSAPEAYRGQVLLRLDRCTGDGNCARACPSLAIRVDQEPDGWTWELDDARCVFCGLCADACPETAISLSNDFELAVRDRADLVTRVRFASSSAATATAVDAPGTGG